VLRKAVTIENQTAISLTAPTLSNEMCCVSNKFCRHHQKIDDVSQIKSKSKNKAFVVVVVVVFRLFYRGKKSQQIKNNQQLNCLVSLVIVVLFVLFAGFVLFLFQKI